MDDNASASTTPPVHPPTPPASTTPAGQPADPAKFQLDDNLLKEIGLGELPAAEKNKMLAHIYETLELRVGMKLAEQMTDAQLDEFEAFIDRNDEAGAMRWLETNFPNYRQVVGEELDRLKTEIKAQAPAILEHTKAQLADGATPPLASSTPPTDTPPVA